MIRVLDALQTDELCPCNWKKGEETLKSSFYQQRDDSGVHAVLRRRARPLFLVQEIMSFEKFTDSLPSFARDIRINLGSVLKQPELTAEQLWGTAVASALTTRNQPAIRAIEDEAAKFVSAQTIEAARTAAAVMAMNNVYYRFLHLVESPERYGNIPARLRM